MYMTTRKKQYEKPSVRIFPLRQKPALLAGSEQVGATMPGTWEEENI